MSDKQNTLKELLVMCGGSTKIGAACGVTKQAVMKWMKANKLPRTEYTGETKYAVVLSKLAADVGKEYSPIDFAPGAGPYMQQHEKEAA